MLDKLKHVAHVIYANVDNTRLYISFVLQLFLALEFYFLVLLLIYGLYIYKHKIVSPWVIIFSLFVRLVILWTTSTFWKLLLTVFIVGFDLYMFSPIFTNAEKKLESRILKLDKQSPNDSKNVGFNEIKKTKTPYEYTPLQSSAAIGKDGGCIQFEGCEIGIPPGALDGYRVFVFSLLYEALNTEEDLSITPILECEPAHIFNKEVMISLPTCFTPKEGVAATPIAENDELKNKLEPVEWKDSNKVQCKTKSLTRLHFEVEKSSIKSKKILFKYFKSRTTNEVVWEILDGFQNEETDKQQFIALMNQDQDFILQMTNNVGAIIASHLIESKEIYSQRNIFLSYSHTFQEDDKLDETFVYSVIDRTTKDVLHTDNFNLLSLQTSEQDECWDDEDLETGNNHDNDQGTEGIHDGGDHGTGGNHDGGDHGTGGNHDGGDHGTGGGHNGGDHGTGSNHDGGDHGTGGDHDGGDHGTGGNHDGGDHGTGGGHNGGDHGTGSNHDGGDHGTGGDHDGGDHGTGGNHDVGDHGTGGGHDGGDYGTGSNHDDGGDHGPGGNNRNAADEIYPVCSKENLILVLSNSMFDKKRIKDLECNELDQTTIFNLFQHYLFCKVDLRPNTTSQQMTSNLEKFLKETTHQDFCAVFIFSHGSKNSANGEELITAVDGIGVPVSNVIKLFTEGYHKSLANKPKLLFIDCCRTLTTKKKSRLVHPQFTNFINRCNPTQNQPRSQQKEEFRRTLAGADLLVAYATKPGRPSYGGSCISFAETLHLIFKNHAEDEHLLDMLIKVNAELTKERNRDIQQLADYRPFLFRKLFFYNHYHLQLRRQKIKKMT